MLLDYFVLGKKPCEAKSQRKLSDLGENRNHALWITSVVLWRFPISIYNSCSCFQFNDVGVCFHNYHFAVTRVACTECSGRLRMNHAGFTFKQPATATCILLDMNKNILFLTAIQVKFKFSNPRHVKCPGDGCWRFELIGA